MLIFKSQQHAVTCVTSVTWPDFTLSPFSPDQKKSGRVITGSTFRSAIKKKKKKNAMRNEDENRRTAFLIQRSNHYTHTHGHTHH